MPTYRRQTRIRAPLPVVRAFHATIAGLAAVTPEWMNLEVEAIRAPDGEVIRVPDDEVVRVPDDEPIRGTDGADPPTLESGSRLRLSIQPFGRGPRQRWVTRIADREERDGAAYFRDEMIEGPFRKWIHTHAFFADGEETILLDEVDYELPFGGLGRAVDPIAGLGFEGMFRHRHARTKELLDGRRDLPREFGGIGPHADRGAAAADPADPDSDAADSSRVPVGEERAEAEEGAGGGADEGEAADADAGEIGGDET